MASGTSHSWAFGWRREPWSQRRSRACWSSAWMAKRNCRMPKVGLRRLFRIRRIASREPVPRRVGCRKAEGKASTQITPETSDARSQLGRVALDCAALAGLAAEGYRSGALSETELMRLLQFAFRIEVHDWLRQRHISLHYSLVDSADALTTLTELGLQPACPASGSTRISSLDLSRLCPFEGRGIQRDFYFHANPSTFVFEQDKVSQSPLEPVSATASAAWISCRKSVT